MSTMFFVKINPGQLYEDCITFDKAIFKEELERASHCLDNENKVFV